MYTYNSSGVVALFHLYLQCPLQTIFTLTNIWKVTPNIQAETRTVPNTVVQF
jgi:hypothetical protein